MIKIFTKTKEIQNVIFGGKLEENTVSWRNCFHSNMHIKEGIWPVQIANNNKFANGAKGENFELFELRSQDSCNLISNGINYYISTITTSLCKMLTCFGINPV